MPINQTCVPGHLRSGRPLAGAALFIMLLSPAQAQQNAAEVADGEQSETLIELIEVTAQRGYRATTASSATGLNVPLEDLPVNIQVITADVVSDFQLLSQRDALQFHAAVDDKRVRGFNTGEFFRNGFIHLSDSPGYTIERLEILRGPSAVLNGPVTPGGAVNVITKKPRIDETFGDIGTFWGFSGDDRDNRGFNLDLNMGEISLFDGAGPDAAFRFVGGFQQDTGFGTRVDNESSALLPMLEIRPTENTVIGLEYYQYSINTDRTDRPMGIELSIPGPGNQQVPLAQAYGIDPRSSWFSDDTDIEESLDDFTLSIAHQFNEEWLANLKYNNHSRDFVFGPGNRPRIDIFYRMVLREGAPSDSTNPADFELRRLTENLSLLNDIDQLTASLAYVPRWGGANEHQFVGGLNLYDQNAHLTIQRPRLSGTTGGFYFEFFDPATIATDDLSFNRNGDDVFFVTVLDRLENVEQNNVFLNYYGSFADDRLNILLGLTHSDIEISRTNLRASTVQQEKIADSSELLLQAGGVYDLTDAFSVYANYSESQLPDLNDPDFNTSPPVRLGEQFEVGLKYSLFDGMLSGNIAYFQVEEELFGETQRNAEADGFEIDGSWSPSDQLTVLFSYAHADTKITASSNPDEIGDPLVDEVPNKAALWSIYNFDAGSLSGLSLGGGLIWTGQRVRSTAGAAQALLEFNGEPLEFDSEVRLDLFAKYAWDNWETSLNLRNLTEEINLSNNVPRVPLQGGIRADGSPYVFDGDIEVMLSLRYRF